MSNPQDLKKALQSVLAEKGDYATLASIIRADEEREDKNQLTKLIKPMSAVADILTENAKGSFMEDVNKEAERVFAEKKNELETQLKEAQDSLASELKDVLATDRDELSAEVVSKLAEAQANLETAQQRYADAIVNAKADAMFANLADLARLSEDEIADIIEQSALSVESQIQGIIGEYIKETGITTAQITDFKQAVQALIPKFDFSQLRITASQVAGLPDYSGAASRVWVEKKIANISPKITVSETAPESPQVNDLWVDIS